MLVLPVIGHFVSQFDKASSPLDQQPRLHSLLQVDMAARRPARDTSRRTEALIQMLTFPLAGCQQDSCKHGKFRTWRLDRCKI